MRELMNKGAGQKEKHIKPCRKKPVEMDVYCPGKPPEENYFKDKNSNARHFSG